MGGYSADVARKGGVDVGFSQSCHLLASRSWFGTRDNGNGMSSSNTPLTGHNEQGRNNRRDLCHMAWKQHARTRADFSPSRNRKKLLRASRVASWNWRTFSRLIGNTHFYILPWNWIFGVATRESYIGDRKMAPTTIIPAVFSTRMIPSAESSAWLRTGNGNMFRIIAMTLKLLSSISLIFKGDKLKTTLKGQRCPQLRRNSHGARHPPLIPQWALLGANFYNTTNHRERSEEAVRARKHM